MGKWNRNFWVRMISAYGEPSCRLFFGAIGFAIFIGLIVAVCIFNYDGENSHIDLIKTLGYICAGLLGLSAFDLKGIGDKRDKNKNNSEGDN